MLSSSDTTSVRSALSWGSESQFNPVSMVLNEAWDIGQLRGDHRLSFMWNSGNVGRLASTLGHPGESIRRQGWGEFLTTEVVPSSFDKDRAQWIPNYQAHLLGGGYNHIHLEEWYVSHGYAHPTLLACATTYTSALLNETSELAGQNTDYSTDPLADLLIFDAASLAFFRIDAVREFFTQTLEMRNWPLQPTLTGDGRVENAGQYWMLRYPVTGDWKGIYIFGLGNIAGLSRRLDGQGNALSLAMGAHACRNTSIDSVRQGVVLAPKVGVFWDRGGSLMASLSWNGQSTDPLALEVYPTPLTSWPVPWGFWFHGLGRNPWVVGITTVIGLGVGVRG